MAKSVSQVYKIHSERLFTIIRLITWWYKFNCIETCVTVRQLLLLFWHHHNNYHIRSTVSQPNTATRPRLAVQKHEPQRSKTTCKEARKPDLSQQTQGRWLFPPQGRQALSDSTALSICHQGEFHPNFNNSVILSGVPKTIYNIGIAI